MSSDEFIEKPLTTNEDAISVVRSSTFEDLCSYIADGEDSRVMRILNALWLSGPAFAKQQVLEAAMRALFPREGYMRPAASVTAPKLAKAIGGVAELQKLIRNRWSAVSERGCTEVVLGLSGNDDIAAWIPLLPALFDLSPTNDVKTQLIKAVNNIRRAGRSQAATALLQEFLRRIPSTSDAYPNINNWEFVNRLKQSE